MAWPWYEAVIDRHRHFAMADAETREIEPAPNRFRRIYDKGVRKLCHKSFPAAAEALEMYNVGVLAPKRKHQRTALNGVTLYAWLMDGIPRRQGKANQRDRSRYVYDKNGHEHEVGQQLGRIGKYSSPA